MRLLYFEQKEGMPHWKRGQYLEKSKAGGIEEDNMRWIDSVLETTALSLQDLNWGSPIPYWGSQ